MSRRVIFADAGPLIALARADSLGLLQALFGEVHLTATVRDEVLPESDDFPETDALARALASQWIKVVDLPQDGWQALNPGVDLGEASAIRAAYLWREAGTEVLLLIDDRAGRREAARCGLQVIGTAAVIGLAKREGLIPEARPVLERLTRSGYFLGQPIISAVLADAGELSLP